MDSFRHSHLRDNFRNYGHRLRNLNFVYNDKYNTRCYSLNEPVYTTSVLGRLNRWRNSEGKKKYADKEFIRNTNGLTQRGRQKYSYNSGSKSELSNSVNISLLIRPSKLLNLMAGDNKQSTSLQSEEIQASCRQNKTNTENLQHTIGDQNSYFKSGDLENDKHEDVAVLKKNSSVVSKIGMESQNWNSNKCQSEIKHQNESVRRKTVTFANPLEFKMDSTERSYNPDGEIDKSRMLCVQRVATIDLQPKYHQKINRLGMNSENVDNTQNGVGKSPKKTLFLRNKHTGNRKIDRHSHRRKNIRSKISNNINAYYLKKSSQEDMFNKYCRNIQNGIARKHHSKPVCQRHKKNRNNIKNKSASGFRNSSKHGKSNVRGIKVQYKSKTRSRSKNCKARRSQKKSVNSRFYLQQLDQAVKYEKHLMSQVMMN